MGTDGLANLRALAMLAARKRAAERGRAEPMFEDFDEAAKQVVTDAARGDPALMASIRHLQARENATKRGAVPAGSGVARAASMGRAVKANARSRRLSEMSRAEVIALLDQHDAARKAAKRARKAQAAKEGQADRATEIAALKARIAQLENAPARPRPAINNHADPSARAGG